jgi:hypothetical protein
MNEELIDRRLEGIMSQWWSGRMKMKDALLEFGR